MRAGWPHWVPWAAWAVYVTGWAVAARIMYRTMADFDGERAFAGLAATMWPVIAVIATGWFILRLPTTGVLTPAQAYQRKREAAETRRMEYEKLTTRIAELERELGYSEPHGTGQPGSMRKLSAASTETGASHA